MGRHRSPISSFMNCREFVTGSRETSRGTPQRPISQTFAFTCPAAVAEAIAVYVALDDERNVEASWVSVEWNVIDKSSE